MCVGLQVAFGLEANKKLQPETPEFDPITLTAGARTPAVGYFGLCALPQAARFQTPGPRQFAFVHCRSAPTIREPSRASDQLRLNLFHHLNRRGPDPGGNFRLRFGAILMANWRRHSIAKLQVRLAHIVCTNRTLPREAR